MAGGGNGTANGKILGNETASGGNGTETDSDKAKDGGKGKDSGKVSIRAGAKGKTKSGGAFEIGGSYTRHYLNLLAVNQKCED